METKEKLSALFEANKGVFLSGEEIAKRLSISRAAVWKAVEALRLNGYAIEAVTNKGYCLSPDTDVLSAHGVSKYLDGKISNLTIEVLDTATSTNALLREKGSAGEKDFYVLAARAQTLGRGRENRRFFSPAGTGLYFSVLLRPAYCTPGQAVRFTTMAAVAVCEAIESVSGETAQIKWVNDVFVRGKKTCGILTEASIGLETGMLQYVVLGVGVNLYAPEGGFPKEIENIAGTIFSGAAPDGKNRLLAEFLNHFTRYYAAAGKKDYVAEYKRRSLVLQRQIHVLKAEQSEPAVALDIDDDCRLLVRYESGREELLVSGEIRIAL